MPGDDGALRVALLGGVPALLGGGGLEAQIDATAAALNRRGHDARRVTDAPVDWAFDVLHVVGNTADVGHALHHWRRHPARLVVSPVVVVPERREARFLVATRLPIPAFEPRLLHALVCRADHVVALTRWEARFLGRVGGRRTAPVSVVGNGVDLPDGLQPLTAVGGRPLPAGFVTTVGAVSPRKRQLEIARALQDVAPYVVIGGWDGPPSGREEFERAVAATGGRWMGEIRDRATVLGVVAAADALVHLSEAEGQSLAVLEALAVGTSCVLSDLPQQREFAAEAPGHVSLVADDGDVAEAVRRLRAAPASVPVPVPTWDDVAARLEDVYRRVMIRPACFWGARG